MLIQKLAYHAGSLIILFCFCITCSGPNQAFEEPPPPLSDTPIAQLDIDTRGLEIPKDHKIMSTLRVFINEELRLEQPMGIESIGIGERLFRTWVCCSSHFIATYSFFDYLLLSELSGSF